jgi:Galactosyltransferase
MENGIRLFRAPMGTTLALRSNAIIAAGLIIFIFYFLSNSFTGSHSSLYSFNNNSTVEPTVKPTIEPTDRWLVFYNSAADDIRRRTVIRSSWHHLYRNDSLFQTRFVISNPGPLWMPIIEQEMEQYNDIIMLPHLNETFWVANTIKTIEFFKELVGQGKNYTWVTKLDEDSWLDVPNFYRGWLLPREESGNTSDTIIGRSLQYSYPFKYPSGQFYTLSWDIVTLLVDLYEEHPIIDESEDVLVGMLLYKSNITTTMTELSPREAFNYKEGLARGDGTPWASKKANLDVWEHAVGPGAINIHLLKWDEVFLQIAECYDKDGLKLDQYNNE